MSERYFIVNKPYGMVSQFVSPDDVQLLHQLAFNFPAGTHAIGRLDHNSEGLLLLTTNKKITRLLFQSDVPHKRIYLVQVRNIVSAEALQKLRSGVVFTIQGGTKYTTLPCQVDVLPGIEQYQKNLSNITAYPPITWLRMELVEGKYHQVRKMVAAVKHKCKRLIRLGIEDVDLGDLRPGDVKEVSEEFFFEKLRLAKNLSQDDA